MEHHPVHTGNKMNENASSHQHQHAVNPPMGSTGHDPHAMMIADFKKRFYIVLVLTVPVMLLSPMIQHWLNIHINFTGSSYLLLLLSSFIFFYGGKPFLQGWLNEIKAKSPGMMTLIGFAITVAYVYSVATVLGLKGMDFFWELSTLILIMLLGHWIEMKSVAGASKELELLVQLMPDEAHLVHAGGHIMDVKTSTLKTNDIILIKPGEKVAADALILDGESYFNESMLTGEAKPVTKKKDDKIIAGSINGNGSVKAMVLHSSEKSYLSQVVKLVRDAQNAKSNTQLLADKAARWLTFLAITAGIITFIAWLSLGKDISFAVERMVSVIVICCPHALGLAVPLVVAKSTALSAKNGLLIKNRTAFENARKISTIVFDKTGTLTFGKFEVSKVVSVNGLAEKELIQLAASLEQNSEHPIATGILQKAKDLSLQNLPVQNFKAMTGKGVEAALNAKDIKIVGPAYLKEKHIALPVNDSFDAAETIVFVLMDDKPAGYIALSDTIRPESASAVQALHRNNIKSVLLTGDNKQVAESVSKKVGIDDYIAKVLPHQKLEIIKELQSKGEFVAMTGDGVNDAPALAQADVGIAVGSGSDIAAETAGIVLVNSNPKDIVNLILFGKATFHKMMQNLAWATCYNVIALPLAAGVLYKFGILLSPAIAAAFMSISTVVVAINANSLSVKNSQMK